MQEQSIYKISTYDDLVKCASQTLDIPDGSVLEVDKDLILQVRNLIMTNQCGDTNILAPYLNRFFPNEEDKLIQGILRYNAPELVEIGADKGYEPYDKLKPQDCISMWLPRGLWERWERLERCEEWLEQTPGVINKG